MMAKKLSLLIGCILLFSFIRLSAQNSMSVTEANEREMTTDTLFTPSVSEEDLRSITDIRTQFEKQNRTYFKQSGSELQEREKKVRLELSPEALYWARYQRDPHYTFHPSVSFRDTIIVNPIYLPPLFRGEEFPYDFVLYDPNFGREKKLIPDYYEPDTTLFEDFKRERELEQLAYRHLELNHPELFRYSERDLVLDAVQTDIIRKNVLDNLPIRVVADPDFSDVRPPSKFIPDRQYWRSSFESSIQFSQNHVSENWHKGGSSNLNLFAKNHLKYDYNRNKIQLTNELESKASIYNSQKDTLHRYQVGEDVFRIHSNLGYMAFNKWHYTLDAEFKTQMFKTFEENTDNMQAAFLAPYTIIFGLGMKYDLNKEFADKNKSLQLSVNLAPFTYTYMYSRRKDIDLGRHGFEKREDAAEDEPQFYNYLSQVGSSVRADLTFNISKNVSWQSRVYYFTTYDKVIGEFENTLILAVSRFFSTRIYCHLRFDDGVEREDPTKSYFQVNELLSFGFNYKW
ncbi:MAG: DUF3078 domain-containing protein [Tannerellaceae bacterium]|nr:DUF3078 domain-containing protein [Tannerellaceae bacterium]